MLRRLVTLHPRALVKPATAEGLLSLSGETIERDQYGLAGAQSVGRSLSAAIAAHSAPRRGLITVTDGAGLHATAPQSMARRYPHEPGVTPRKQASTLRIAHVTDLHWLDKEHVPLRDMTWKRFIAYANLELFGRAKQFDPFVREQILDKIDELRPDVLLITGDLTSIGSPNEFAMARRALLPLLRKYPSYIIPGNHDTHYHERSTEWLYRHFVDWLPRRPQDAFDMAGLGVFMHDELVVLGLHTYYNYHLPYRLIGSRTAFEPDDYVQLGRMLNRPHEMASHPGERKLAPGLGVNTHIDDPWVTLGGKLLIYAQHYPVLNHDGRRYDEAHPYHAQWRTYELIHLFQSARRKPHLIVHGHDHMGFSQEIQAERDHSKNVQFHYSNPIDHPDVPNMQPRTGVIPIHNPGSGSLTYHEPVPGKRRDWHQYAAFNLYTARREPFAADGDWSLHADRWVHDGKDIVKQAVPYTYLKQCGSPETFIRGLRPRAETTPASLIAAEVAAAEAHRAAGQR